MQTLKTSSCLFLSLSLLGCSSEPTDSVPEIIAPSFDFMHQEYNINNAKISLRKNTPGSRLSLVKSVEGDLNNDGANDAVAVVSLHSPNEAPAYYIEAFLNTENSYMSAGALFVNKNINIDTLEILPKEHIDSGHISLGMNTYANNLSLDEQPKFYITHDYQVKNQVLIKNNQE